MGCGQPRLRGRPLIQRIVVEWVKHGDHVKVLQPRRAEYMTNHGDSLGAFSVTP